MKSRATTYMDPAGSVEDKPTISVRSSNTALTTTAKQSKQPSFFWLRLARFQKLTLPIMLVGGLGVFVALSVWVISKADALGMVANKRENDGLVCFRFLYTPFELFNTPYFNVCAASKMCSPCMYAAIILSFYIFFNK